MRYALAFIALVVFAFGAAHYEPARATQNAVSAYNACAAEHNFAQVGSGTGMVSLSSTFAQAYNGGDFERDAAALFDDISQAMASVLPPPIGSDVLSMLLDWPDP